MSGTGYRDKTEALAHENESLRKENDELRARIAGAQPIAAQAPRSTRTVVFMVAGMLIAGGALGLYFARPARVAPVQTTRPLLLRTETVGTLSVIIRSDGTLLLDGDAMNGVQFSTRIRVLAGVQPNLRVVINADRDVAYARVVEVMDDVRTAGFQRVAIATAPR